MKKLTKISLGFLAGFVTLFAIGFIAAPAPAFAADDKCTTTPILIFNSWTSVLPCDAATGPKITKIGDFAKLIFWAVDTLFKGAGVLAFCWFTWGCVKFVKATGNPQDIAEARETLLQAVIGLMIAILAVAIVNFLLGIF